MKLFYFNPNGYGYEYIVMSDTKENALQAVKNYLLNAAEAEENKKYTFYMDKYNEWESATTDILPEQYSIDEYEQNTIVETYNG
jgi:hypothetical protein